MNKRKKKIGKWFIQSDEGEIDKHSEANTAAHAWAKFCYPALKMAAFKKAGYKAVQMVPPRPKCEWTDRGVDCCKRLATHLAKAVPEHVGMKLCKAHSAAYVKIWHDAAVSRL